MEGRKNGEGGHWEAGGEKLDRLQCVLFLEAEGPFHWPATLSSAPPPAWVPCSGNLC